MICFDDDDQEYWQPPEIPRRFFDWIDNPLTDDHAAEGSEYYNQALITDQACWILQHSPTIQAAFDTYEDFLPAVFIRAKSQKNKNSSASGLNIFIDPVNFHELKYIVNMIVHEFVHAAHYIEGLNHDDKVLLDAMRVMIEEADAVSHEITVAYELIEGFPKVWSSLRCHSDSYKRCCDVFEEAVKFDTEALWNGLASRKAFEEFLNIFDMSQYTSSYGIIDISSMSKKQIKESLSNVLDNYYRALRGMPFFSETGVYVERENYMNPKDLNRIKRIIQRRI